MLIREYIRRKCTEIWEVKAVKWLNRKEVLERSYGEMMEKRGFHQQKDFLQKALRESILH